MPRPPRIHIGVVAPASGMNAAGRRERGDGEDEHAAEAGTRHDPSLRHGASPRSERRGCGCRFRERRCAARAARHGDSVSRETGHHAARATERCRAGARRSQAACVRACGVRRRSVHRWAGLEPGGPSRTPSDAAAPTRAARGTRNVAVERDRTFRLKGGTPDDRRPRDNTPGESERPPSPIRRAMSRCLGPPGFSPTRATNRAPAQRPATSPGRAATGTAGLQPGTTDARTAPVTPRRDAARAPRRRAPARPTRSTSPFAAASAAA